jgi:hypothetical protein
MFSWHTVNYIHGGFSLKKSKRTIDNEYSRPVGLLDNNLGPSYNTINPELFNESNQQYTTKLPSISTKSQERYIPSKNNITIEYNPQ